MNSKLPLTDAFSPEVLEALDDRNSLFLFRGIVACETGVPFTAPSDCRMAAAMIAQYAQMTSGNRRRKRGGQPGNSNAHRTNAPVNSRESMGRKTSLKRVEDESETAQKLLDNGSEMGKNEPKMDIIVNACESADYEMSQKRIKNEYQTNQNEYETNAKRIKTNSKRIQNESKTNTLVSVCESTDCKTNKNEYQTNSKRIANESKRIANEYETNAKRIPNESGISENGFEMNPFVSACESMGYQNDSETGKKRIENEYKTNPFVSACEPASCKTNTKRIENESPFCAASDDEPRARNEEYNNIINNISIPKEQKKEEEYYYSSQKENPERSLILFDEDESKKPAKVNVELVKNLWNETVVSLRPVRDIKDQRLIKVQARIREEGWTTAELPTKLKEVFQKVQDSEHLSGRSGKWLRCSFDWVFESRCWNNILEGKYDNITNHTTHGEDRQDDGESYVRIEERHIETNRNDGTMPYHPGSPLRVIKIKTSCSR